MKKLNLGHQSESRPELEPLTAGILQEQQPRYLIEQQISVNGYLCQSSLKPTLKPAIIVWDIENVLLPHNIPVDVIVNYLKQRFITSQGFYEYKTVCGITTRSLTYIEGFNRSFLEDALPVMTVLMSSRNHKKLASDFALSRELSQFTHDMLDRVKREPMSARIILLTGDCDFLEPFLRAQQQGFDVQLIHDTQNASKIYKNNIVTNSPAVKWQDILNDIKKTEVLE